jgi:hypothetical protein
MRELTMAMIKHWLKIVHSLSIEDNLKLLRVLNNAYATEWISVFVSGALHSGAFEAIAERPFAKAPNWHTHVCQFVGGPNDLEYRVFNATLGTYVADCLLREVRARGHRAVYTMYYNLLRRKDYSKCSV